MHVSTLVCRCFVPMPHLSSEKQRKPSTMQFPRMDSSAWTGSGATFPSLFSRYQSPHEQSDGKTHLEGHLISPYFIQLLFYSDSHHLFYVFLHLVPHPSHLFIYPISAFYSPPSLFLHSSVSGWKVQWGCGIPEGQGRGGGGCLSQYVWKKKNRGFLSANPIAPCLAAARQSAPAPSHVQWEVSGDGVVFSHTSNMSSYSAVSNALSISSKIERWIFASVTCFHCFNQKSSVPELLWLTLL